MEGRRRCWPRSAAAIAVSASPCAGARYATAAVEIEIAVTAGMNACAGVQTTAEMHSSTSKATEATTAACECTGWQREAAYQRNTQREQA